MEQALPGVRFNSVSEDERVIRESAAICDGSRVIAVVTKLPQMCFTERPVLCKDRGICGDLER